MDSKTSPTLPDEKSLPPQFPQTPLSEDVVKESLITPASQELEVPALHNTSFPVGIVAVPPVELHSTPMDATESVKPSSEAVPVQDRDSEAQSPTVLDEDTEKALGHTQASADQGTQQLKLDNETDDLKAQIQQLQGKIREYEMLLGVGSPTEAEQKPDCDRQLSFETKTGQPMQTNQGGTRIASPGSSSVSPHTIDMPPPHGWFEEIEQEEAKDMTFIIPRLNWVSWEAFQECAEVGYDGGRFAIDVLVGEPDITVALEGVNYTPIRVRRRGGDVVAATTGATATTTTASQRKPPGKTTVQGQAPLPERIRINSRVIIKILNKINEEDPNRGPHSVLMMQPFRALVFHKDEFRKWRARLEAKFGETDKARAEPETDNVSEQDSDGKENVAVRVEDSQSEDEDAEEIECDPDLNNKTALDELNCLMEFIETDLEGKTAYLASEQCQKVAFSDIWHLFKPGDFVLSKDEKQAYRVVNVQYSTHCMRAPLPKEVWMLDAGNRAKLEDSPITIQCVCIDFDGEKIGPVLQTISIHRFNGEKNIRSLDIIPLRLAKKDGLVKTLIARGSMFIEVCDAQSRGVPMHYSGFTLETQEEVDSQVVIDFEEAFAATGGGGSMGSTKAPVWEDGRLILKAIPMRWKPVIKNINPGEEVEDSDWGFDGDSEAPRRRINKKCIPECCSDEMVHNDKYVERSRSTEFIQGQFLQQGMSRERVPSLVIAPRSLKEGAEDDNCITDDERLIVSYRVFGFIMRSRKWAKLDLTYLGPMKGENKFDLLVLPPGHRQMVESLVTQHFLDKGSASDESDEVDIVRGKGKGLILLLHGAPGVGKTTTAECVATYFHKPLFQITCGDLGSTADVVESRLETNFALASRWGCILLIDEADVFLEARQTENFDRNSLVAVFLRTLEYYNGILFLTTNRVGTFDEAFTSRIHISLYYPPLSQASTLEVFRVNLSRIQERFMRKKERGEADLELDERSINEFILRYYTQNKEARWNGRQIRNACQTALALAEFEAQKLANPGVVGGRSVMELAATSTKMIKVRMSAKHFHSVAKAYLAFIRYLKQVHGVSAAQQAKNFRLRQDRYGLEEPVNLLASRQRAFMTQQKSSDKGAGARRHQQSTRRPDWQSQRDDDYAYDEEDVYDQGDGQGLIYNDEDEERYEDDSRYGQEDEYDEESEEDDANLGPLVDEQDSEDYEEDFQDEQFDMNHGHEYDYGQKPKAKRPLAGPSQRMCRGQQAVPVEVNAAARGAHNSKGSGSTINSGRLVDSSQRVLSRGGHGQRRRVAPRRKPDAQGFDETDGRMR